MGHRLVKATDEQVGRLGGPDETHVTAKTARKSDGTQSNDADVDDAPADVDPMKPADIVAATDNDEVREILAAANQAMADHLKLETDRLLDSVLYTTSMKMSNGFNRSDN